jgi:hypothetical protein
MGRKTETELCEDVEKQENYQYEENDRKEIDTAYRWKTLYISWQAKERKELIIEQKSPEIEFQRKENAEEDEEKNTKK